MLLVEKASLWGPNRREKEIHMKELYRVVDRTKGGQYLSADGFTRNPEESMLFTEEEADKVVENGTKALPSADIEIERVGFLP